MSAELNLQQQQAASSSSGPSGPIQAPNSSNSSQLRNPGQFDVLHLQGLIKLQQRSYLEGVDLVTAALRVNPNSAEALANLGLGLAMLDRHDEAVASFDKALAIRPDFIEVLCSRGVALGKLDRRDQALASFDRALAIKPDHVQALYDRAVVLGSLDRHCEAVDSYDRALAIDPAHAKALNNRGVALGNLNRNEESIASFDQALAIKPDFAEALLNRGLTLAELGRHGEAIVDYDRALTIDAGYAEALFNRATSLVNLNRNEEALIDFDQALAIKPDWADAVSNRGVVLGNVNRQAEAIAAFRRATAIEPDHPEANWNEGLAWLRLGDFRQGWAKYEWRWASKELASQRRTFAQPLWVGDAEVRGKTILLHAEQGLGDTIQFVRYAPLVARLGTQVILEIQPPLEKLLSGIEGVSRIIGRGKPLPEFDVHCPLLSLPLAFQTEIDTIPTDVPYISALKADVAKWGDRLSHPASLRVGIAWTGSRTNKNDHNRSIPLNRLASIFPIPGVQFVSIQKGTCEEELELLRGSAHVAHVGDELKDFADTAAVISLLDLVVSVDTSIAHLAGAMMKPVWILVPFAPDFRWMLDREDSPWYPTARLFRQPNIGDWESVLRRVRRELIGWVEAGECSVASSGARAARLGQTTPVR